MVITTPVRKKTAQTSTPADALAALVGEDLARVNALISRRMQSPVGMIPDLATHLVDAGGKRLRPMITLATASMLGYCGDHHIKLATAVEFIHSATLLHDDIVDGSTLRRGKPAANRLWGNSASVLVGDFLFARSFSLMVETGHLPVLDILARASSVIAEGEVHQLAAVGNIELPMDSYIAIIEAKTAELFAAAAKVSAVIAGGSKQQYQQLDAFGRSLGLAFQLVDDALDYGGEDTQLGKRTGDDFREGKLTLPLLLAVRQSSKSEKEWLETVLEQDVRSNEDLQKVMALIEKHGGLQQTIQLARNHAKMAKDALLSFEESALRTCLMQLCDYVVQRAS